MPGGISVRRRYRAKGTKAGDDAERTRTKLAHPRFGAVQRGTCLESRAVACEPGQGTARSLSARPYWPAILPARPVSSSRPKNGAGRGETYCITDWKPGVDRRGCIQVHHPGVMKLCFTSTSWWLLPNIGFMHVQVTSHCAVPTRWSLLVSSEPPTFPISHPHSIGTSSNRRTQTAHDIASPSRFAVDRNLPRAPTCAPWRSPTWSPHSAPCETGATVTQDFKLSETGTDTRHLFPDVAASRAARSGRESPGVIWCLCHVWLLQYHPSWGEWALPSLQGALLWTQYELQMNCSKSQPSSCPTTDRPAPDVNGDPSFPFPAGCSYRPAMYLCRERGTLRSRPIITPALVSPLPSLSGANRRLGPTSRTRTRP